jgi:hypothetical protein
MFKLKYLYIFFYINIPNASRNIFLKKFFRNNKNWPSYDGLKKKALHIRRKYGTRKYILISTPFAYVIPGVIY